MTSSIQPAIEVQHLTVNIKRHFFSPAQRLLDNIQFKVMPGTICAFLGANGAGKTTCLRTILGLLAPDEGTIRLFGEDARRPSARRGLGYLPERPYLPTHLSGHEFVYGHACLSGVAPAMADEKAIEALRQTGLDKHRDKKLSSYSKGMLQRVGLAQVISGDPRLLILDEPLSGLDPQGRREVRELIAEQRRLGRTVLFSTHVLADVALLADQVLIIKKGQLRHNDTPEALEALTRKNETYVEIVFDALEPSIFDELKAVTQHGRTLPGSSVIVANNDEEAMHVIDRARHHKLLVRSLSPIGGGLEFLFHDEEPKRLAKTSEGLQ